MLRRQIIIDTACIIGPMHHHPTTAPPLELLFTVFKSTSLPLSELRSQGVRGVIFTARRVTATHAPCDRGRPRRNFYTIITPLFEPFPPRSINPLRPFTVAASTSLRDPPICSRVPPMRANLPATTHKHAGARFPLVLYTAKLPTRSWNIRKAKQPSPHCHSKRAVPPDRASK
jgi:hypothetical protein